MVNFFRKLFASDFMAHGFCLRWDPGVLWLHIASDGLTALAYYIIPIALIYFVRKRKDLAFDWMFVLFGVFILACGTTHLMAIITLWDPMYRLEGLIKGITALASVPTAFLLVRLIPSAVALPRPEDLRNEIVLRTRAEEQLRKLNDELERRVQNRTARLERYNDALQRLAYISNHDLREPLRHMTTMTQLLQLQIGTALKPSDRTLMEHIIDSSSRMQNIVDDLLGYTRILNEVNEDPPISEVSLRVVLAEAEDNLRDAIQESQAHILCKTDLPVVLGNPLLLRQVLQNLLSNSMKYRMPDVECRIEISARRYGPVHIISVRDNGVGIKIQYADVIFEAFKRLHGREIQGSGVGLAICKNIVESLGGRIWVESNGEGTGSTFHFTLNAVVDPTPNPDSVEPEGRRFSKA